MNITRYEPWNVFDRLHRSANRLSLFDQLFNDLDTDSDSFSQSKWSPAVDVKEEDKQYVITADLPGVDPKDIEVVAENGVLSIKGERTVEKEDKQDNFTRRERSYGSFYRSFHLPDNADADKIQAKGKDGVLEISLPKRADEPVKRIKVKS